jgi:outer membrane receptor protein involved in Fe transport
MTPPLPSQRPSANACRVPVRLVVVLGLICLSFAATVQPQSSVITIEGVVLDQQGGAISRASVTVSAASTVKEVQSDAEGRFRFEAAPGTIITLTVTAPGFARLERRVDANAVDATQLRLVLAPASVLEQVTVTAARTATRISETAASIASLGPEELQTTAALTLDDALRQVPGFSLFRRSGSRSANPTAQGVSLRGLGASGASRAIVLADGVPLNDPFGGWVYWDRVPRESVNQVEVLRGGASHLYGSSALGGVVNILMKKPGSNTVSLETSYGNQLTPDGSLFVAGHKNNWAASLAAESFRTNGYVLVSPAERGPIDTLAGSRHAVVNLNLQRSFAAKAGESRRVFGGASFFGESRTNGTPLQTNRTHLRQFTLGADWQFAGAGLISARSYVASETFDQNFTSISADRKSETLTRVQRVPAQVLGLSLQWSRPLDSKQTMVAGFETHQVRGASDEIAYTLGRATSLVDAGGKETTVAGYFEDVISFGSRLFITAGGRLDHWRNFAALAASRPLTPGTTTLTLFPDRSETAFSPQLSLLYKLTSRLSFTGSASRAFRAPTLNELYRSFRAGNVMTLANEQLQAERLTAAEAGARFTTAAERIAVRGNIFWDEITRPVANVTLKTTPALITRQRQNLGLTRSRGVEIDAEARLNRSWNVSAGYLLADATVIRFPANTALEGLQIPQVARHQFTFQTRFTDPRLVTIGFQGRASSSQFDDDQNLFRLGRYFTLDAFVSRRIRRNLEGFLSIENLFNQRYEIGKTPVTTLGPPLLVRAGMRFHFSGK